MKKQLAAVFASAIAATGLVACGNDDKADDSTVTIGTTDSAKKAWSVWEDKAKENGINLEIENFSDYNTPNQALTQKQIDANLFQHLDFLATYNVKSNSDLAPVGSTEVVPLALFWKDHDSIDGIDGEEVAIPNDPTNQARAINVLKSKDLVKLKKDDVAKPTPADVDTEKSKVKLTPVDAAQTSTAYFEGKPAIINNTFLDRAGIDPKTAVLQDDPSDPSTEPFINVLVTTKDNVDNENLKKLVELWHTPEVQQAVEEDSKGTSVSVDRSQEDLQKILDRLEEQNK
ncbi:MetQ/NlpA family ABC transporter substrate-binding protein [Corynebacterium pelargi]|uniref:D-methionine-binding lipoprotein MetQ n=1 Tax=Corynebacterium pelargi TaxID=1471400 RepID=A0A410WAN6_9CORY|nr:MetQ/NlpA family ABC transporter substrate-binding protein [Corynebacterium pelargi]QAU53015.1 D-methionine-binding lipoprotein MetQ precursor [Corynebacterium pelargi]GGG75426.1 methionine ABC transporter substrate-binding protein [Corynebacterium pelargi]